MDANSGSFHAEAVLGNSGIANSRQVWSDNSDLIRELWNQGPPHPRGLGVVMEKDHLAGGSNGVKSRRFACCMRCAASVSLRVSAMRCKTAGVSPGRRYCAGLG